MKFCTSFGRKLKDKDEILEKELGKVGFKCGASGGFGDKLGGGLAARILKTDEVHDNVSLQKNLKISMKTVIKALSSMGIMIDMLYYSDYQSANGFTYFRICKGRIN